MLCDVLIYLLVPDGCFKRCEEATANAAFDELFTHPQVERRSESRILRRRLIRKEETQVVPWQCEKFTRTVDSGQPREESFFTMITETTEEQKA